VNDITGKHKRRIAAVLLLIVAVALASYFVRPPGAGQVYQYRTDQYGLQGSTALVLRKGDCLVLSRSEADIGRAKAARGAEGRLFAIAAAGRVESGSDRLGDYLVDRASGLKARPGDAIDGEILFRGKIGGLEDSWRAGWPLNERCGSGLAVLLSIARVHD
jgi:hypothetical protein